MDTIERVKEEFGRQFMGYSGFNWTKLARRMRAFRIFLTSLSAERCVWYPTWTDDSGKILTIHPSCKDGEHLDIDYEQGFIFCPYCGRKIEVKNENMP